jgi:hypothetical protein
MCSRWIFEPEVNTWMRPAAAGSIACPARSMSALEVRASAHTIGPCTSRAMRWTASKSPCAGDREAGLDDVDVQARELARDLDLLGGVERDAGRLLAVAQGGVEDADVGHAGFLRGGPVGTGVGSERSGTVVPGRRAAVVGSLPPMAGPAADRARSARPA